MTAAKLMTWADELEHSRSLAFARKHTMRFDHELVTRMIASARTCGAGGEISPYRVCAVVLTDAGLCPADLRDAELSWVLGVCSAAARDAYSTREVTR